MTPADYELISDKLNKLIWLECVFSIFHQTDSKVDKEIKAELKETKRLQRLCKEEANRGG